MAISKLYTIAENLNMGGNTLYVKGFQSVRVRIRINTLSSEGKGAFVDIYGATDLNDSIGSDKKNKPPIFIKGVKQNAGMKLDEIGDHYIYIDTSGLSKLQVNLADVGGDFEGSVASFYEPLEDKYKGILGIDEPFKIEQNILHERIGFAGGVFDVTNYKSAKIIYDIKSSYTVLGIYASRDKIGDIGQKTRPPVYYKGKLQTGNITLELGYNELYVDLDGFARVNVNNSPRGEVGEYSGESHFIAKYEALSEQEKRVDKVDNTIKWGGYEEVITLPENAKQFDISVIPLQEVTSGQYRIQGSKDGEIFENLYILNVDTGHAMVDGYLQVRQNGKRVNGLVNVEGYKKIKIKLEFINALSFRFDYEIHTDYIDRTISVKETNSHFIRGLIIKGYKYVKLDMAGVEVKNCSARLTAEIKEQEEVGIVGGDYINFGVYNSAMHPLNTAWDENIFNYFSHPILGDVAKGELIFALEKPLGLISIGLAKYNELEGSFIDNNIHITLTNSRPERKELPLVKEANDYNIYQLPFDDSINSNSLSRDVFGSDLLEYNSILGKMRFYQGGYNGILYEIDFNNANVPSLKEGERIKFARLIPFNLNDRSAQTGDLVFPMRIVVFTNMGRILHNFPDRKTGNVPNSDFSKFDESIVYNSFKKWLPVNEKSKETSNMKYFPVLKDYDYNQFDGRVNGTSGFVDHFNSGGLPSMEEALLLDNEIKDNDIWGVLTTANLARDSKMTLFGNYNAREGMPPIVIGTNTGGQIWHTKASFACTNSYPHMKSGKVDFTTITDVAGAYVSKSLKMGIKRFNIASNEIKEPITPFLINESERAEIVSITEDDGTMKITVSKALSTVTNHDIIFFENVSAHSEWDYICNNGFTEDNTVNNGVFFRVIRLSDTEFHLYADLGNAYEGDQVCRHIHAVNRTQSGYLISTGETTKPDSYEGGFLYYLEQNYRNGANALDITKNFKVIRLTSSSDGVNRAAGAYLFNDSGVDPTIIVASDDTNIGNKRIIQLTGRTETLKVSPIGIYKGKISDIDDLSKFECICELKQTLISLVEHHGNFAADGMTDALCISKGGLKWNIETVEPDRYINGFDQYGNIYFGDKVIKFK